LPGNNGILGLPGVTVAAVAKGISSTAGSLSLLGATIAGGIVRFPVVTGTVSLVKLAISGALALELNHGTLSLLSIILTSAVSTGDPTIKRRSFLKGKKIGWTRKGKLRG